MPLLHGTVTKTWHCVLTALFVTRLHSVGAEDKIIRSCTPPPGKPGNDTQPIPSSGDKTPTSPTPAVNTPTKDSPINAPTLTQDIDTISSSSKDGNMAAILGSSAGVVVAVCGLIAAYFKWDSIKQVLSHNSNHPQSQVNTSVSVGLDI